MAQKLAFIFLLVGYICKKKLKKKEKKKEVKDKGRLVILTHMMHVKNDLSFQLMLTD